VDDAHRLRSGRRTVRQTRLPSTRDYWGETSVLERRKLCDSRLFERNEYWFWLGTEVDKAKVSVRRYDSDGKLAEEPDSWEKGHFRAAHVIQKRQGSYFIIVSVEQSPEERAHWRWCMVSSSSRIRGNGMPRL